MNVQHTNYDYGSDHNIDIENDAELSQKTGLRSDSSH